MVKRNIVWIILFLNAFSCYGQNGNINLIIYTDFVNPKTTYDRIAGDMLETNLLDSIKIIGRPVHESQIEFQIDTALLNTIGLSKTNVNNKISSAIKSCKDLEEISKQYIVTNSGRRVPISEVSKFYVKQGYYKPEIFIPIPELYYYEDKQVVLIELYCGRKNVKTLIKYIEHNIQNYADSLSSHYLHGIEYKIVR